MPLAAGCIPSIGDFPVQRLPREVWALGLVSLFMDVSSEMIHGLLPVFLVGALGVTPLVVGLIDGVAEAVVYITKLFSGVWSDRIGRRKPLLLWGYGLAALSKPLFPLASSAWLVLGARLFDRFGKGIRGAPRDALIADVTPEPQRGAAYGLRQCLDTVGAFVGPLLAIGLMAVYADDIRRVFAWAVVPAILCFLTIVLLVREPEAIPRTRGTGSLWPIRREEMRRFGAGFWKVQLIAGVFGLARFSEAFLLLRVEGSGVPAAMVPMTLIVMNVVYALSAYPAGKLADRMSRRVLLLWSALLLFAAHATLAVNGLLWAGVGVVLWGLHMGASQGVLSALVADCSPKDLRGTAFGLFNLIAGLATLLASSVAGAFWTYASPTVAFAAGALMAAVAAALLASGPLETKENAQKVDR